MLTLFSNYLITRNGLLSVGAGIAASVGVYTANFLNSTTWGGSLAELVTLYGALFVAFTTASTTVSGAGADKSVK